MMLISSTCKQFRNFHQPRPLDAAQLLDWESEPQKEEEELLSDIAPPAASEFEEAGDGRIKEVMSELKIDSPVRKKEELEVQSSAATESPNIFNIGLSKNGMNLLLGKEVSRSSKIALSHDPPKVVPSQPQPKLAPIPRQSATPELPSVSGSQQLAALLEESRYESSPVLKLNTRTFRDISDDSATGVDITPGTENEIKGTNSLVGNLILKIYFPKVSPAGRSLSRAACRRRPVSPSPRTCPHPPTPSRPTASPSLRRCRSSHPTS